MKTQIVNVEAVSSISRLRRIGSFVGLLLVLSLANSAGAREIKNCRDITAPGQYLLDGDLLETQAQTACLTIHDTQNVVLDCQHHRVTGGYYGPAISITNVQGFAILRCTLEAQAGGFTVMVSSSSDGTFSGNTIGDLSTSQVIQFRSVNHTSLTGNTLNAPFQQYYSSGNTFRLNTATCPKSEICAALFVSGSGSDNTFFRNKIDGQGSSQTYPYGADDGIYISDERGDLLSENTIQNTWDTGIETGGNIVNMHIKSNTIANVAYAGIGGWYWNSWRNVRVINNSVSNAPQLFAMFRICGLRPHNWDGHGAPADGAVYFQGNFFAENQFDGSAPLDNSSFIPIYDDLDYRFEKQVCGIPGELPAKPADFQLHNNTFTQNDFGHLESAPYFAAPIKAGYIIDGGGNICSNPGQAYPLICN